MIKNDKRYLSLATITFPPTTMDTDSNNENKTSNVKFQYEQMLHNAILVTEMAMELKERAQSGEKYVCYLRSLAVRASRTISTMHGSAKTFIVLCQRLTSSLLKHLENNSSMSFDPGMQNLRQEYERLVAILDKEIFEIDDLDYVDACLANEFNNLNTPGERLRNLETKQKYAEQNVNLPSSLSARSFRSDVDEKYPDNWSKDSLISLNNVVNLPPVPEDVFTSFSKPVRTSSLSSLKSIRKVKLFLQRSLNSEDEESECDDHELSMSDDPASSSEGGESRSVALSVKKVGGLCNIKEETPQDP